MSHQVTSKIKNTPSCDLSESRELLAGQHYLMGESWTLFLGASLLVALFFFSSGLQQQITEATAPSHPLVGLLSEVSQVASGL